MPDKEKKRPKPPAENSIDMYFHCRKCIKENERSDIEAGWTKIGFQVWCRRHDINIIHVDFEGYQHPANLEAK